MNLFRRIRPRSRAGWAAACAAILVVGVTSVAAGATGDVIRIGKRTAGSGETAIVGNTGQYATRQSNNRNGDGGAASYGCRAPVTQESCLFVLNHNTNGSTFRFQSDGGASVGRIQVVPPAGKQASDTAPFTTNATGVATGLNADKVDGQDAADIVNAAKPPLVRVNADGTINPGARGLAASNAVQHVGLGDYRVTFASDVSACAYSATESTPDNAGAVSASPVTGQTAQVEVVTRQGGGEDGTGASGRADRPFDLVVNC
jgi:hypothetical protein